MLKHLISITNTKILNYLTQNISVPSVSIKLFSERMFSIISAKTLHQCVTLYGTLNIWRFTKVCLSVWDFFSLRILIFCQARPCSNSSFAGLRLLKSQCAPIYSSILGSKLDLILLFHIILPEFGLAQPYLYKPFPLMFQTSILG